MNLHPLKITTLAAAALALGGCATMDGRPYYSSSGYGSSYYGQDYYGYGSQATQAVYYGRVESVRTVAVQDRDGVGAGAVIGALVGGAIGNQIGDGSGRTAATIGGALAGGYIGNRIQDSQPSNRMGVEVVVRLDNGQRIAVIQDGRYRFYEGQRVRVSGSGRDFQVVPY